MEKAAVGIRTHVDAGKTHYRRADALYGQAVRKLGRVDKAMLFWIPMVEEERGNYHLFLSRQYLNGTECRSHFLDAPGHVDFSAEMERTLQVLDYAVLVISGTDGVRGHTQTLWRLLAR